MGQQKEQKERSRHDGWMLGSARRGRSMPFLRRDMAVDVDGKRGVVTGGHIAMTIQVRFEGQRRSCHCHPSWETTSYDRDGTIIAEYRRQAWSSSRQEEQGSSGIRNRIRAFYHQFPSGNYEQLLPIWDAKRVSVCGHHLQRVEHADEVVIHHVPSCQHCGTALADQPAIQRERRQVFDVPPKLLWVVEHQAEEKTCPQCHQVTRASFPQEVRAAAQYGAGLAGLVQGQFVPYARTAQFVAANGLGSTCRQAA